MPVEMNKQTATDVVNALADLGIECKYEDDMEAVLTGVDSAYSIADNFGSYYSWNGYYLSDLAAVKSAIAVEAVKHNELMAVYEKVKDAEKIEVTSTGINYVDYDFAELALKSAEAVTFADGKVTIDGMQVEVSAADVMVNGEVYEIRFALAAVGENEGEYDSAILLGTESSGADSYSGSALNLTKSAKITIPACTAAGKYTLVAYVATISSDKETYTYEEIYGFLSGEVLKYGYPSASAVVEIYDAETGEGTAASEGDVLSGCTCRLQYDIANLEGMTGYVYVELP
ncbi:MAG: hypothetical protein IJF37_00210 [Lachnospiraceae bacterium]|nr:hypothetical protein [Lachnospiraceae bacterium]